MGVQHPLRGGGLVPHEVERLLQQGRRHLRRVKQRGRGAQAAQPRHQLQIYFDSTLQYIFSPTILATRSPILPSLTLPSTTHTLAITQVSISDLKFNDIYLGFKTGAQKSG